MKHTEVQQAAVSLFAEKGFTATGIRDIGALAGLNSATLYHYADNKEDLLVQIMSEGLSVLLDLMNDVYESSADPAIQLVRFVRTHVAFGARNPLTSRVTDQSVQSLSGQAKSDMIELRDAFESLLERILQRGKLTKTFDIDDARIARLAIIEMNNGIADWFKPTGRLTETEVQIQFSKFACRLVGVKHPSEEEIGELADVPHLACEPPSSQEN